MTVKTAKFTDAQAIAKTYPETFEAPDQEELDKLRIGDSVKINAANERFWVTITNITKDAIMAVVDNDLVLTEKHGLSQGDFVKIQREHVYSIMNR